MKKVVITGANGFVGSNLTKSFAADGYKVIAVVKNESSDISSIKDIDGVEIVYCELDEIEKLPEIIQEDVSHFLHFAWQSSAGADRGNPLIQFNNVENACKSVKAAKQLGCERYIFAGSIMAYEAKEYILNDYACPTPAYIYSTAKLSAEMAVKTIAAEQGIEFIDVVISNIFGVGEKSARFLNATIRKILAGEELNLTSCEQLYDFIYVTDAADAIKTAALKGENLCSYYIGNEEQYPLKSFILEAINAINPGIKANFGAIPFKGTYYNYHNVIDTSKLTELGFKPKISFKEGVEMLAESIRRL